jgi:FdhD protein
VREHRQGAAPVDREDRLVTEEPLEIRCSWPGAQARRVGVTMRTPGHDFELAAGFLHGEGVLGAGVHPHTVAYCTDEALTPEQEFNVVTVALDSPPARLPAARYDGPGGATSACGVCGTESIADVLDLVRRPAVSPWEGLRVDPEVLHRIPAVLRESQRVFDATGGLHAAGLFDADGTPLVVREDVGRHNAVDKVVGARLLARETPGTAVLAVSGRTGFEIVQKAVAAGVGVVVAVGEPTGLAVELARSAGLCTIGFAGAERFVTYSLPDRVGV